MSPSQAIVIGGGPAGLMAADVLLDAGLAVELYDAMPSLGRKFLMAGKSGLNITHAEPIETLLARYGAAAPRLAAAVRAFDGAAIRAFAAGLGVETFIGSSGRVFPTGFKAAPLLRAWLHRLRGKGLRIHVRHQLSGIDAKTLCFETPGGTRRVPRPAACILALGGASWPTLGSDGAWAGFLGVPVEAFGPSNCGFDIAWSPIFRERFAGQPVKPVTVHLGTRAQRGEFVVGHFDPGEPAFGQAHRNVLGPGIDRILDQFFERRCGSLNHLARSDAVDQAFRQAADYGHGDGPIPNPAQIRDGVSRL